MFRFSISVLVFSSILFFSVASFAQSEEMHVVHIQTNKLTADLGDDAEAFGDMLRRQAEVYNKDPRLISSNILRHNWGSDSRDLIIIAEFKSMDDLESFYNDLNTILEEGMSKEQLDKDNELWGKYVGMHSDEVYAAVRGTKK
jgi:hypothetical protein